MLSTVKPDSASRDLPPVLNPRDVTDCRDGLPDPVVMADAVEVFRALGSPVRLRLVHALTHRELSVGDLARAMDLSLSSTSHQLALLRRLKLVSSRDVGRVTFYRAIDDCVGRLVHDCLAHTAEKLGVTPSGRKLRGRSRVS